MIVNMIEPDKEEPGVGFILTTPSWGLTPRCYTDDEVDAYAERLKLEIDQTVIKMKAELRRQKQASEVP